MGCGGLGGLDLQGVSTQGSCRGRAIFLTWVEWGVIESEPSSASGNAWWSGRSAHASAGGKPSRPAAKRSVLPETRPEVALHLAAVLWLWVDSLLITPGGMRDAIKGGRTPLKNEKLALLPSPSQPPPRSLAHEKHPAPPGRTPRLGTQAARPATLTRGCSRKAADASCHCHRTASPPRSDRKAL